MYIYIYICIYIYYLYNKYIIQEVFPNNISTMPIREHQKSVGTPGPTCVVQK